ncbi:TIM barrel protein [Synoicihabitans lomoniglobus]|uniref:TIM barrel protein n=1 Tax=Synoicihabitans lomoniglobus TaxID=2909285 RepID=A0AAF0CSJ2_9BACT|nr:TIM barrel protein [Opitutaceae bacterium LMO-M01]WED67248.1 TIM barrel protein [Opitutaceae bacterium LMO-M01]
MTRRDFMQTTAALGAVAAFPRFTRAAPPSVSALRVHLFSKHLQFLDYAAMAAKAAELGFDGVDLTVRPRGHVEPAEVKSALPRAAAALRRAGLEPVMCTTGINTMADPLSDTVLGAIADAGFTHLRLGYHQFSDEESLPATLTSLRPVVRELATALQRRGLQGAFQNHAGARYVGASIWELWQVLEDIDPTQIGLQFDIRHVTAERGLSWINEYRLAAPKIASLALKDSKWIEDPATGRGTAVYTPVGEGWVDWPAYFKLLQTHAIDVPASLHLEYDLGGADHGHRQLTVEPAVVYAAMQRDLQRVRKLDAAARRSG